MASGVEVTKREHEDSLSEDAGSMGLRMQGQRIFVLVTMENP